MAADPQIVSAFGDTDLFGPLKKRALRQIASAARIAVHNPGQEVTAEGDGGVASHLVLEGPGNVSVKGKSLGKIGPGDYFGEIALIDEGARSATITANEELVTYGLTFWDFRPLVQENAAICWKLLQFMVGRLRAAEARG